MLKKRQSSAKVLFDSDDLMLLKIVAESPKRTIKQSELISKMGISHKGFLTHKNRLLSKLLILEDNNCKENYKIKYISISYRSSKDIIELFNIFSEELNILRKNKKIK